MESVSGLPVLYFVIVLYFCFLQIDGGLAEKEITYTVYVAFKECNSTADCYPLQTCSHPNGAPQQGSSGYCHCAPDHVLSDSKGCVPLQTKLGGDCLSRHQCSREHLGRYVYCKDSKCSCTDVASAVNGKCILALRHIDEECYQVEQCQLLLGEFGECSRVERRRRCACSNSSFYDPFAKKCFPLPSSPGAVRYGGECKNFRECMGDTKLAVCNGRCACTEGYIPSTKLDNCLPILHKAGEGCSISEQCQKGNLTEFSACRGNPPICLCGAGGVYDMDQEICVKSAEAEGDACEFDLQCTAQLEHAVCLAGTCRCMEGTKEPGVLGKKKCILSQ